MKVKIILAILTIAFAFTFNLTSKIYVPDGFERPYLYKSSVLFLKSVSNFVNRSKKKKKGGYYEN